MSAPLDRFMAENPDAVIPDPETARKAAIREAVSAGFVSREADIRGLYHVYWRGSRVSSFTDPDEAYEDMIDRRTQLVLDTIDESGGQSNG